MVRYGPEHKVASRQRLVQAGARMFRRKGFNGVGINDLCAEAGLTRGAFYGHFESKSALLAAVLAGAHDFVRRLKARSAKGTSALRRQANAVARDYLAPKNRSAVLGGCSLGALAMDVSRGGASAQQAYAEAVQAVVSEFRRAGDDGGEPLPVDQARAVLALCVGGLLIDNACGDNPEGARVARAAQREVARLLGTESTSNVGQPGV